MINGQWYEFDDQYVTEVHETVVQNAEAYVLFYRCGSGGMPGPCPATCRPSTISTGLLGAGREPVRALVQGGVRIWGFEMPVALAAVGKAGSPRS